MIDLDLRFQLPPPWDTGSFETSHIGEINFFVGANGSGKSQFAKSLHDGLSQLGFRTRLLGTDRLAGMEQTDAFASVRHNPFSDGLPKDIFENLKEAGKSGAGIDAIVLLGERMDLLIQVEATLNHLFDRDIILEWDSGRLVPKARRRGHNALYRLDREECHGIKELLVLMTHLYDNHNQVLIIDEPELNLHPQYQAFFVEEAQKVAGNPISDVNKKAIFLVTHSPFAVNLRSVEDLGSIITFDLDYSAPKQVLSTDVSCSESFVRRLNAHHKQLFFSDNPIFVEGIFDAWIVQGMMEALNVSISGAGSCVIDSNGAEEANQYLNLCQGLGKDAHFLYDLDALFIGTLRHSINEDESIRSFLLTAGLGDDFGKYCGQLERKATDVVDKLLLGSFTPQLLALKSFLGQLGPRCQWRKEQHAKARVALMTAISKYRDDVISMSSEVEVSDIEARLGQILAALKEKNVHVLPGGALERYLPHFKGSEFDPTPDQKREAVLAELETMTDIAEEEHLMDRYTDLYKAVLSFPSKDSVNLDIALHRRLATYIHGLQQTIVEYPGWGQEEVQERMNSTFAEYTAVFSIHQFQKQAGNRFQAAILIANLLGQGPKTVDVTDQTNAGMGRFELKSADPDQVKRTQ